MPRVTVDSFGKNSILAKLTMPQKGKNAARGRLPQALVHNIGAGQVVLLVVLIIIGCGPP